MKYNSDDVVVLVSGKNSYNPSDYVKITGFATDELFQTPQMWHTASQNDDGTWVVSVKHKNNRTIDITLSDESYKRYRIADLKPSVINPFGVEYNDEDLVEIK